MSGISSAMRRIGRVGMLQRVTAAAAAAAAAGRAKPLARALSSTQATAHPADDSRKVLVTGASGQIGAELVPFLRARYGSETIIATDLHPKADANNGQILQADVLNKDNLSALIVEHNVGTVIHNATLLSALGEANPQLALKVNAHGSQNILELAREHALKVYCPSTIAVFGPTTPQDLTPDVTIMQPTTMYGITKVHLELLGAYYHAKFGVDFRSLRYPGVISSEAVPGGGTTDYAVEIYYKALQEKSYTCFLEKDQALPMMFMPDCIKATVDLIEAPDSCLKQRTYNVTAMSFTPEEVAASIRKHIPQFEISYAPDFRQSIAATWPRSLDDSRAREDWGWSHDYNLDAMTEAMLTRLDEKLSASEQLAVQ